MAVALMEGDIHDEIVFNTFYAPDNEGQTFPTNRSVAAR
jgi:hypothetical protein